MTDQLFDEADTNAACAKDPDLAAMRQLLLTVEFDAHKRGWDHDDNQHKLFEVCKSQDGFGLRMAGVLQRVFDEQCGRRDGHVGLALLDIAKISGMARQYMGVEAAKDLYQPEWFGGSEVYGWGLLSEVWMVRSNKDWTPEELEAFAEARGGHRLSERPDRIEGRMIYLVCRDGNYWSLMRERGHAPVVTLQKPEADLSTAGAVPHALGLILDSIVNNPVPVPDRGENFWRSQAG